MTGAQRHAHLAEWFANDQLVLGTCELARELDAQLRFLPWASTSVRWDEVAGRAVADLNELMEKDAEMAAFLDASGFAGYPLAAAFLAPTEPPIIGLPEFLFAHLDEIFWRYPGPRFVFGYSKIQIQPEAIPTVLAQYSGTAELTYIQPRR